MSVEPAELREMEEHALKGGCEDPEDFLRVLEHLRAIEADRDRLRGLVEQLPPAIRKRLIAVVEEWATPVDGVRVSLSTDELIFRLRSCSLSDAAKPRAKYLYKQAPLTSQAARYKRIDEGTQAMNDPEIKEAKQDNKSETAHAPDKIDKESPEDHPVAPSLQVESIARICHDANRAYCRTINDLSHEDWDNAPEWQKQSARDGVKNILEGQVKSPEESHKSWCDGKLKDGWSFGKVKDETQKTHPSLLPWEEIAAEVRLKDYLFFAIVHTMSRK